MVKFLCDSIGVIFQSSNSQYESGINLSDVVSGNGLVLKANDASPNLTEWTTLEGIYTANGDELYIQIGLVLPSRVVRKFKRHYDNEFFRHFKPLGYRRVLRKNRTNGIEENALDGFYIFIDSLEISEMN